MAVYGTTTTPATIPGIVGPSSQSTGSPVGTTALDALQVTGVGALLGLPWGKVSVTTAVGGFRTLAAKASKGDSGAQQQLAQIQQWMYGMGLYGSKKPTHGASPTPM